MPLLTVTAEESLTLVAETVLAVIRLQGSDWLGPEIAEALVPALMEVWVKNVKGTSTTAAVGYQH